MSVGIVKGCILRSHKHSVHEFLIHQQSIQADTVTISEDPHKKWEFTAKYQTVDGKKHKLFVQDGKIVRIDNKPAKHTFASLP